MATRAAACKYVFFLRSIEFILFYILVSSKIRALNDFYSNIASGVTPLPNGYDIANAVKYFSQTLLG